MNSIEILLVNKTNVFDYTLNDQGVYIIGDLLRTEDQTEYTLDLFEGEKIPITYAIQDIIDPSKKKSPFSKNFLLPGTKNNQKALKFPYMISNPAPFQTFNGEQQGLEWRIPVTEAQIYVEGILTFSGKLELSRSITNQGEINSFEVNFLATAINIFDEIENKLLTQLDFPTPVISSASDINNMLYATDSDRTFNIDGTIYNGWTAAYPDWGFPGPTGSGATAGTPGIYSTTGTNNVFKTATEVPTDQALCGLNFSYNLTQYAFVRTIIDKIFAGTSFSFNSTFFDSDEFKSILLLYYDSNVFPSNTGIKLFGSNPTATTYFDDAFVGATVPPDTIVESLTNINNEGKVPSNISFNTGEYLMDPFAVWDNDNQELIFPKAGTYTLRTKAIVEILYGWDQWIDGDGDWCPGGTAGDFNLYPHTTKPLVGARSELGIYKNDAIAYTVSIYGGATGPENQAIASPTQYIKDSTTHYQWEAQFEPQVDDTVITVEAGDRISFAAKIDLSNYKTAVPDYGAGCIPFDSDQRKYMWGLDLLIVDVSPVYHNWSQTLPSISHKEFFQAILKHFNIYTELTSLNPKTLTFETRDDFYNTDTEPVDWTDKVDISSIRQITRSNPPLEVWARMKKTKNDIDIEAQNTSDNELEYGSYRAILENGKENIQTIQSSFGSLTPNYSVSVINDGILNNVAQRELTENGVTYKYNIPNPALFSTKDGVRELTEQSEMYLAYKNANVQPVSQDDISLYAYFTLPGDPGVIGYFEDTVSLATSLWGVAGMTGPQPDINYRATRSDMFVGGRIPPVFDGRDNRIISAYEAYYEDFYKNLNSQRVIGLKVRLDAGDIAKFSFRTPIFIEFPNGDSSYFIVSKINYDPTTQGPYSVELLTFNKEYFNFP